ncbi:MAG TPA: hypothetical protein VLF39_00255 [Candidatus Saccharimonadales bacterium]|nr:hypothetical protein [Candidatus Saccharimonadales bacterium]
MDNNPIGGDVAELELPGSSSLEVSTTMRPLKQGGSKRWLLVMLGAVILLVGLISLIFWRINALNKKNNQDHSAKTQSINLSNLSSVATPFETGNVDKLVVNGQLQANQGLVLTPTTKPDNAVLGQIYIDQDTNQIHYFSGNNFVTLVNSQDLAALQAQLQQTRSITAVTSLQNQSGALTLLGGGGLTVGVNGHQLSLNLPQNLTQTASPTFNDLALSGVLFSNTYSHTGSGHDINFSAGNDSITFTANGKTYILPNSGSGVQTICTDQALCLVGGGTAVLLGPQNAQADASTNSSLFIDKQNSGNLLQLQLNGSNKIVVANSGNTTISANLTITGVLSANTITPSGPLTIGTTAQTYSLVGDQSSSIVAQDTNNHRVTVDFQASGSVNNDVTYYFDRSTAAGNYAVCTSANNCSAALNQVTAPIQGTATYIPKFTGGLTVGNSAISDNGATVTINSEDFNVTGGSIITNTISSTGALTIGSTGQDFTLQGNIGSALTIDDGGGNTTAVGFEAPSGANTITFPALTGTVCLLEAGNCSSSSSVSASGGSNNGFVALFTSNTNITASILAQSGSALSTTGTLSVGGASLEVGTASTTDGSIVLQNANNVFTTSISAPNQSTGSGTVFLPDTAGSNDTVCLLVLANCNGGGGGAAITGGGNAGTIALFTGSGASTTIGDSILTQSGGALTVAGDTSIQGNLTFGNADTVFTNSIQQTANGQNMSINAGADSLTITTGAGSLIFSDGSNSFTLPTTGGLNQVICTSGITCAAGGGVAVTLGPNDGFSSQAQSDPSAYNSIFIDKANASGNILDLQRGGTDELVVANNGDTTIASTLTVQSAGSLTLGNTSGAATGSIGFRNGTNGNVITLQNSSSGTNYSLTLPTAVASVNGACLTSDTSGNLSFTGAACATTSGSGSFLGKNINDTSSFSFAGNLYGFTNTNTGAAGVLSLTNSGTNSALKVVQASGSSNPGGGQALILANNTATTPSGNLIDLQAGGISKFSVDVNGAVTVASTYNTNTFSSSQLIFGAAGTASVQSAATRALNLVGNATSTFSTSSGDVALTPASGTVDLTSATLVKANGNLTIKAGGTNTLTLDTVTSGGAINFSQNTTVTGTKTFTVNGGLTTLQAGLTANGGTISLNASSNNATNINTGTSTGAINIGNSANAGAVSVQSATSANVVVGASTYTFQGGSGNICTSANNCSYQSSATACNTSNNCNAVLLSPGAAQSGFISINSSLNAASLSVSGAVAGASLSISGSGTISTNLTVSNNLTVNNNATVANNLTVDNINGSHLIFVFPATCFGGCNAYILNSGQIAGVDIGTSTGDITTLTGGTYNGATVDNTSITLNNGVKVITQGGSTASLQWNSHAAEIRSIGVVQVTTSGAVHLKGDTDITTDSSGGGSGALTAAGTITAGARIVSGNGLTANGTITSVTFGAASNKVAVCRNSGQLNACTGAPTSDYAELYPVASDVVTGDVVEQGDTQVPTYLPHDDGSIDWGTVLGTTNQMVKSTTPYSSKLIGVMSGPVDKTVTQGYNIKAEDNPKPVALSGRVVVKVTTENGSIQPGDFLTASATLPGYAMKATHAGYVIGQALSSYNEASPGLVMVFVGTQYYPGPSEGDLIQNGGDANLANLALTGDLNVSGQTKLASLSVTGATTLAQLTVSGSATFNGTLSINGHIISSNVSGTTTAVLGAAACASPTITLNGNDTSGTITIVTGTGCSISGVLATVDFANAFGASPRVVLSPAETNAAKLQYFNGSATSSSFTIDTNTVPTGSTTYKYNYFVVQ